MRYPMLGMSDQERPEAPVIMIVDDDDAIREGICELLQCNGYAVVQAANGRQALDLLEESAELPSMLLLDLSMPVMDGWELTATMLSRPALSRVPITSCPR